MKDESKQNKKLSARFSKKPSNVDPYMFNRPNPIFCEEQVN